MQIDQVWQYRSSEAAPLRKLCAASAARVYGSKLTVVDDAYFFTMSGLVKPAGFETWPVRQRTAIVRAWVLAQRGGLFVDETVLVFRPLRSAEVALDAFPFVGYAQFYREDRWRTDIMACAPGNPVARAIWEAVAHRLGQTIGDPDALALDRQLVTHVVGQASASHPVLKLNGYYWRPITDAEGQQLLIQAAPERAAAIARADLEAFALLDAVDARVFMTDAAVLTVSELLLSRLVRMAEGGA